MSKITASSKNSNTLPANKSKREKRFLWFILTAALLGGGREESWKDVRTCPQLSSLLYHSILSFPLPSLLLLPSPFSPSFLSFLYFLPFSSFLFPLPFPLLFLLQPFSSSLHRRTFSTTSGDRSLGGSTRDGSP